MKKSICWSVILGATSALILSACDARSPEQSAKLQPASQQSVKSTAPAEHTAAEDNSKTDSFSPEMSREAHGAAQHGDPNAPAVLVAESTDIDFGDVPTSDAAKGKVRLTNTGDKPVTVIRASQSCGCTTTNFKPNTVVNPKETIDVDVQITSGLKPGRVSGKQVTFTVQDHPPVVVRLSLNAVSFVELEPATLDATTESVSVLKLRSIDNMPFRIRSMTPAVLTDFGTEAKVEHELTFDWAHYFENAFTSKCTLHLDHPKCQQLWVDIKMTPEQLQQMEERRQKMLGRPGATTTAQTPQPRVSNDSLIAGFIKDRRNDQVLARIKAGMELNHRDSTGSSLLALAARFANTELMQALLEQHADVESVDNAGLTPLMWAARSRSPQAVRVLLDAGASITARDNIGGTALSWAAGMGDAGSVRELIDAGAAVDVVGVVTGWTPLIWAAGFGEAESIGYLLEAHANIEAADHLQGATPLIHAARTGKPEALKVLIERGANLENEDRNGKTALLAVAENSGGTVEKLQILIDAGANLQAKDSRGLNALDLARKRTDPRAGEIVAVLEQHIKSSKE